MKILADSRINYSVEAYSQFGDVKLFELPLNLNLTREIDILIMRSDLRINSDLLTLCTPKFIGCPTVGTDHVDFDYLSKMGIGFSHAPGCNSDAVRDYVMSCILLLAVREKRKLREMKLGVVGVGKIGSAVAETASELGMKVLLNDPPRARLDQTFNSLPLDQLMDVDVLTLHVPLNPVGHDRTLYLFDQTRLRKLRHGTVLINASRGPVVSNVALASEIQRGRLKAVLDVWENEPRIDVELLKLVEIGTAHVAGQTVEARVRGAESVFKSCCQYLRVVPKWCFPERPSPIRIWPSGEKMELEEQLLQLVQKVYNIEQEDKMLRQLVYLPASKRIKHFYQLRRNNVHREFSSFRVEFTTKGTLADACQSLGFQVEFTVDRK